MARLEMELPTEILKDIQKIHDNTEKIFGEMTKAGAQVALDNINATLPNSALSGHVKLTKIYKTPSDRGINTRVVFTGYLPFSTKNRATFDRRNRAGGKMYSTSKGIPAEFIAIMYEYGRSSSPFPKKPFVRKAFNQGVIKKAMLNKQKEVSGGLLE